MLNAIETRRKKKETLVREVIWEYHPTFSQAWVSFESINFSWLDTSELMEETMAHVGNYEYIDAEHADFTDGSDCKTASVNIKKQGKIDRVVSHAGKEKSGMLRVVIYNAITGKVMFYALPKWFWRPLVKLHGTHHMGGISYSYRPDGDRIPKLEEFRCKTFEELCLTKNDVTIEIPKTEIITLEKFFV